ncbi:MAG: glutamate racemase [bacterium]
MKIGVFDSGYGGLTILDKIRGLMPEYDYIYLGDNARTPYGTRSYEVVYQYTWEAVKFLLEKDCQIIILACNTASAKALRSIQQYKLNTEYPNRRVLGVIRPTVEAIDAITRTRHIGLVATPGTVLSNSYPLEVAKQSPDVVVYSQACPMWVPLIENGEHNTVGADFFVQRDIKALLSQDEIIDTLILGCTHYPLLIDKIKSAVPDDIQVIMQGEIVAESFKDYLARHPEFESLCTKGGTIEFLTTEHPDKFQSSASTFLNQQVKASYVKL